MAIGTTMAILGAAAIGAGGSILGAAMSSNAAQQASNTQAEAMDKQTALQAATTAQAREDAMPWMTAGRTALNSYMGELGLSDEAKRGSFKSAFTTTPGYDFQVKEGEKAVSNNMAALGMKQSGAALKALTRFRQGLAATTNDNYLNRLQGAAGMGQSQVNNTASQTQAGVNAIGQSTGDSAAARASGYVGTANAWNGAIGNIANTGSSALGWLSGNKGWAA